MERGEFMDKAIEAIIAREAGYVAVDDDFTEDELIERENEESSSDAYTDADAREERIELENDTIDTLVDESQDVSSEGID
jgi:transcription termination/antitermination protein NusA